MRLADIMSTEVKTVGPGATLGEARTLMETSGIHHLVVVEGGLVVGLLSARDLGGRSSNGRDAGLVESAMSPHVVSMPPDATIRQAANRLRGRGIGSLAVMDGGKLRGIVTTSDLLELIGRGVERPIERSTRWTLRGRGQRGGRPQDRHARHA
ncbi:MAG TPA: CBS domain-containing protein [Polyangia bacterium]|nr:CBS domain-containing protein [Polyangia bacterium]